MNETVSEKLTRIENAVDRIRVKTDTAGDAIETVASTVEAMKMPEVEAEQKDINFYDYDGFRIASWTLAELDSKTELPANPRTHDGLIFQEWNWTLAQLKTNNDKVCVGALYKTDDDTTRLYLDIPDDSNVVNIRLVVSSDTTLVIDWGDNNTTSYTETSANPSVYTFTHTYTTKGKYIISLDIPNFQEGQGIAFQGENPSSGNKYNMFGEIIDGNSYVFNFLYKVELSGLFMNHLNKSAFNRLYNLRHFICSTKADSPGAYTFYDCEGLETIFLPQGVTAIGTYAFELCQALKYVSLPYLVEEIKTDAFRKCYVLKELTFPHNPNLIAIADYASASCNVISTLIIPKYVASIGAYAYAYDYGVPRITIPSSVTNIAANAFRNNYCLKELHFKGTNPPIVANSNAFINLPTTCKIYVPTGRLSAYTSASNYPSSSSYTYIEE